MANVNATSDLDRAMGASATPKDIEVQLEQLRADISSLARTVAAVGNDKASEYKGKAKRAANDAADASMQLVDDAKVKALSLEKDLERQIRSNPIQAVAIAAGVGFVFALLTRR